MKNETFMKKTMIVCALSIFFVACGGGNTEKSAETTSETTETPKIEDYDPHRGEGKFHEVALGATLDQKMVAEGEKTAEMKCLSCHKLSDERLVGPGWHGVTTRHQPEWIMNFMTNTDEMIDKDPKVQAMLEICMVRMPNQSLSDEEARDILEFMRKNDGVK
jgi:cytochrome c551/c552